jgi:alpha-tubulin suppressor-like RCC1 family protein
VLAVDERGKLWGWGKNENYQLGIPDSTHSEGIFKPMELKTLNDLNMKAIKIATCWNHSLVLF